MDDATGRIVVNGTVTNNKKEKKFKSILTHQAAKVAFVALFVIIGVGGAFWASAATTTTSLWSTSSVPQTITTSTSKNTELGLKFQSKVAGQIVGMRFYKGPQNTGTHVGKLWNSKGVMLAKVTFENETNYGWQTAMFSSPITIAANATYVIGYNAPNGHYSVSGSYFKNAYISGSLTALQNGSKNGGNGVYARYDSFPSTSGQGSNYWVDVLFNQKAIAPPITSAPPTNVQATQKGNTVVLSWNAAVPQSGATVASYQILRNGATYATISGATTSWTDQSTTDGSTYTYQITATDSTNAVSPPSTPVVTITLAATTEPTPPPVCPAGETGTPPNCVTPTPIPPVTTPPPTTTTRWVPTTGMRWNWQIANLFTTSELKTDQTENGATNTPQFYDIDYGFIDNPSGANNSNSPATVIADGKALTATIHTSTPGSYTGVVCYVDAGTWENWRADESAFPAALLGKSNGWPGEKWLNTNPGGPNYSTLQQIMTARFTQCKNEGFDAVEPDNLDGSENNSGFSLTTAEGDQYAEWIANEVHSLGMSVALKNFNDQSKTLAPYFDFSINEQCIEFSECSNLNPFVQAKKPVFDVEYTTVNNAGNGIVSSITNTTWCSQLPAGIDGMVKGINLDDPWTPCPNRATVQ